MTDEHNAQVEPNVRVTDEMVEAAAKAMCEAWYYARIGTPDGNAEWKGKQTQYRKQARAAIEAALSAAPAGASSDIAKAVAHSFDEQLRKALSFYADPANYIDTPAWDGDPDCVTEKAIPVINQEGSQICDCGDIARAALSSAPVPPVSDGKVEPVALVKPLEWECAPNHSWQHYAKSVVGYYCISDGVTEGLYLDRDGDIIGGRLKSLEEGKASAQADYEQRILSALASPPARHSDEEVERLRAARKKHVDAVAAYNDRLTLVKSERERGNHSMNVDAEYRAVSEAQSAFIEVAQSIADAALQRDAQGGGE